MIVRIFLRLLEVSISTSFIIFLLCLTSRWLNRRYEPKWKYYIWLLLAVRLMIPVNISAINGISILPDPSEHPPIWVVQNNADTEGKIEVTKDNVGQIIESQYNIDGVEKYIDGESTDKLSVSEIAAIVWCVGLCVFTAYQLYVYFIFRHDIFINGKISEKNIIKAQIVRISDEIRLHRKIIVIVNSKSRSPMMLGIIHPVLVIPREDYTYSEFNMITRHELTHCKRRDIWFKVFLTAVNALHWFNPLVYLMVREANADIELCCDADVLQNADHARRKEYVDSILMSMERCKGSMPGSTCFSHGGVSKMKERFENIYNIGKKRTGVVLFTIIAIMSVLLGTFVSCSGEVQSEGQGSVSDSSVKSLANILPIDESSGCELVDIEEIPDMPYPAEGDYLTLHEALYAFNYARSKHYAGMMALPEEERGESVYLEQYLDCKPSECGFFGSGVPCDEWKNNNHRYLPFHSTDEEFIKSDPRPAWAVIVKPRSEVADYTETIWIDAQTGDLYNDTNSGGYFPSPYVSRSEYSQFYNKELAAGGMTQKGSEELLKKLYEDLWTYQYELKKCFPSYVVHNEKNEFIINWGYKRIDMIKNGKYNLSVPSKPNVDALEVYRMQTVDDETVQVEYNVLVSFQNDSSLDCCDKVHGFFIKCNFKFVNNAWMISDIGDFPWIDNKSEQKNLDPPYIQEYYDEYSSLYGIPEGVLTQSEDKFI